MKWGAYMMNKQSLGSKKFNVENYRELMTHSGIYFFEWDMIADCAYFFSNALEITDDILSQGSFLQYITQSDRLHPEDKENVQNYINFITSSPTGIEDDKDYKEWEHRIKQTDGEYIWWQAKTLTYFIDNKPYKMVGSLQNIDVKKRLQDKLKVEAERDPLTGLYNKATSRNLIELFLHRGNEEKGQQALLIIDIDGFKAVNDTFGHLFGDAVITDIAMAIEKTFRQTDIIGRIGGDEFVVLLKEIHAIEVIQQKCESLLKNLRKSYKNGNAELKISASIGIALASEQGTNFEMLFKKADIALYSSKHKGKDRFTFYRADLAAVSHVRTRYEVDLSNKKAFKDHTIEFIFKLLYETKDVDTTINMALGLLGQCLNLDRVCIYILNKNTNTLHREFEWVTEGMKPSSSVYNESVLRMFNAHYENTQYGEFSICCNMENLTVQEKALMQSAQIKAYMHCKIMDGNTGLGCIGFDDCKNSRVWTEKEYEMMGLFSSVLGGFLLKQVVVRESLSNQQRLCNLIDATRSLIYIIDKNTYEILYLNKVVREMLPETIGERKCYSLFQERIEPCVSCPLSELKEDNYVVCEKMYHKSFDLFIRAEFSNIEWEAGRETCLVIGSPLEE